MAQSTNLAAGLTAANGSADISVPAGETWHIGLFTDDAAGFDAIRPGQGIQVTIDTPSSVDTIVTVLTRDNPVISITGKATVRTKRTEQTAEDAVNVGVFVNDQV